MSGNSKKNLTTADDRQDIIFQQLKDLALEKRHGMLECKIVIRDGRIQEVRHRDFEGVIR